MKVLYIKKDRTDEIEVNDFYRDIAEKLKDEDYSSSTRVKVVVPDVGDVEYSIRERSGTQMISEVRNNLPETMINTPLKDRFLTYVDPQKNSYKFYRLTPKDDGGVKASWGRMGEEKGKLWGEKSFDYPATMYWIKYMEKVGKGYVDRTYPYLEDREGNIIAEDKKFDVDATISKRSDTAGSKLYNLLRSLAQKSLRRNKVKAKVNYAMVEYASEQLDKMSAAKTVDEFNDCLMDIISVMQRPVPTGDGSGVRRLMAYDASDFGRIIEREDDIIQAMEGYVSDKKVKRSGRATDDFGIHDIEVYPATEAQKKIVMNHLSDSLKKKVKEVYRVIPKGQKKRFDKYVEKNGIKDIKMFWHGSRNENWLSIVLKSLILNPNAIKTGEMFGKGLYFAPSSLKSWNYTSFRGTTWAHGSDDIAIMGLYATAYGKPYDVYSYSSYEDYKRSVQQKGKNCLHAHAGSSLRADEIVYYDPDAVLLNYICVFE